MNEPAPADLIAWMESNSRKLTLLEDERYALRRRNEKLERLLREARNCRAKSFCVHSLNIYRVDFEAFFDLLDALSDLDKEDA